MRELISEGKGRDGPNVVLADGAVRRSASNAELVPACPHALGSGCRSRLPGAASAPARWPGAKVAAEGWR